MLRTCIRSSLMTVPVIVVAVSFSPVASAAIQEPAELARVSTIELLPGTAVDRFTLRVRCDRAVEYSTFWVGGRTFVLDVRNAYTPFRGSAIKDWSGSSVTAVRASQFMEGPVHIARVEVDVSATLASAARWSGTDLEVAFAPPGPTAPAAGRWTPPPGTTGATRPAPPDTGGAEPAVAQPAVQLPAIPPGGRDNPFDPIVKPPEETDRTNIQTRPLPNAEQLTLTGIIFNENQPDESVALLRDAQGSNYRMKRGDRVLYGFVSRVTANEIVFSLDIYGRRKEVRLTLDNPQER